MMMYKLLAELDFRHFGETGLPVTNLRYVAEKWGPLPDQLHAEITQGEDIVLPDDFSPALFVETIEILSESGMPRKMFKYTAKRKPNLKVFSPRQQRILEEVRDIYRDANPTEASEASHEQGKPWTITVARHGQGAIIDLLETIQLTKPLTREIAEERLRERNALVYNYGE